ncbi:MAG: HAMP domain-containing protein [Desulfuromonadales bacterium]|nr:HAMP domain-containing protein [Desulfuromonadales bacterium]NIR33230.1 HAMP domain-containing protein [Desulfuromonadales bacterium]NIS40734.1 HAMP domain-containing protein [Desulfuromonadales bacterium]
MRIALKHQIILAPAAVLFMMFMLLAFLQYSYWDLTLKRQKAKNLRSVFIAVAEADLAAQRLQSMAVHLKWEGLVDRSILQQVTELHVHLAGAVERIQSHLDLPEEISSLLKQSVRDLDPERGLEPDRFLDALALLRPQLDSLSEMTQKQREEVRSIHSGDIDELVVQTAFVSIITLGIAILIGIFLSLFFARRILRRIQALSDSAGHIADGDLTPPSAPESVRDELDDLAVSINRMTERLIHVVGSEKLLEGAEEERRRIAMDLHDQTLSDLSSVLRGLQSIKKNEDGASDAADLENDLKRVMTDLREVMDNLHPQTLDILGLGAALESHIERLHSRSGMPDYHLYVTPEVDRLNLPKLWKVTLYRIAIEAIHNVIKHSRAGRYEINIDRRNGELVLSVEDNGTGIDANRIATGAGRGLNNIQERAKAIGGQARWGESRFTTGTRFELTLPLPQSRGDNNGRAH